MAYIAGTSAVAPSGPRLLLETFKLTNAPLALFTLVVQDFQMSKLKFYIKLGRISIFTFN